MKTLTLTCRLLAGAAMLVFGLGASQAQTIYRIVGADGRVTFSDKPPAQAADATARSATGKPIGLPSENANLPYELRQVVTRYPVTLYSGAGCVPCTSGRLLLQARGVPFTEYTISSAEDIEALQRLSGAASLPFLTIGGQKIKGFSEAEWTQFINAANYPPTSKLPTSYRPPAPKPLVVVEKIAPAAEPAESRDAPQAASDTAVRPDLPATAPSNPAGIRF